jgi:hypothetical protein
VAANPASAPADAKPVPDSTSAQPVVPGKDKE